MNSQNNAYFQRFIDRRDLFAKLIARVSSYRPDIYGAVILFSVGIGIYFILPLEPVLQVLAVLCLIAAGLYLLLLRVFDGLSGWVLAILFVALGLTRAIWHSASVNTPRLPDYDRSYAVTGWVEAIERSGSGERLRIRVSHIEGLAQSRTPEKLRLRLTSKLSAPTAGSTITVRAAAKAPPGPVIPGGYDPARTAYFDQIGGFGFTYGAPEILPDLDLPFTRRVERRVVRWRYGLAERIMAEAPEETAGLQTALMTGVRRYIPQEQTDNLRISGLAHILAISGLHMGLLAGGVFGAMTFCMASIPWLGRRMDVRKPAAMIGIAAATLYLVLSGASVATQRAYIMAVIVFLAVILDRRALSLRSVALAAVITLWLHPESLMSVGFQMSFAAVTALIVTYQIWQDIRPGYKKHGFLRKGMNFFASLSVTSFVAGFATAAFALFHFNRMARYGLLGNLIAMPVFSLAVMPLAVLSLILMPLGLEYWPLWLMGQAISYILVAAEWVAGLDGALWHVHGPPPLCLPLFTAGFIGLCLWRRYWKVAGALVMAFSFLIWATYPAPDMRISQDGQVAYWSPNPNAGSDAALITDQSRGDRYGREQFAQMSGRVGSDWIKLGQGDALCDQLACRIELKGYKISLLQNPSEVPTECEYADLVILSVRAAGPVARRNCAAKLIDERYLEQNGAVSVYLGEADRSTRRDIKIRASKDPDQNRPWM